MLINKVPISVSTSEDTTCFIIYSTANIFPLCMFVLLAYEELPRKIWFPTQLLAFGADKYDASLCTFSSIWIPWNLIVGLGCVDQ